MNTQTPLSKEIPQIAIQYPSSSTQISPFELSEQFHTNLTMDTNDSNSIQLPNFPHEPLLFYLRDHELYYTSFYGPRYNETAIFIDYQEWYNSSEISFCSYLKLIKAYQTLVQDVNNHSVLIVMPTGYINYFKWFRKHLEYWTTFELIFSDLFQKCSLMFIFVQLIKVVLKSSHHYIIHSKSMLLVLFTQNMIYVANSYKMISSIFATNYRLLQD